MAAASLSVSIFCRLSVIYPLSIPHLSSPYCLCFCLLSVFRLYVSSVSYLCICRSSLSLPVPCVERGGGWSPLGYCREAGLQCDSGPSTTCTTLKPGSKAGSLHGREWPWGVLLCINAENPCAGISAPSSGGSLLDAGLTTCAGRMLITIQSPDGDSDLDPPWSIEAYRCHAGL